MLPYGAEKNKKERDEVRSENSSWRSHEESFEEKIF